MIKIFILKLINLLTYLMYKSLEGKKDLQRSLDNVKAR